MTPRDAVFRQCPKLASSDSLNGNIFGEAKSALLHKLAFLHQVVGMEAAVLINRDHLRLLTECLVAAFDICTQSLNGWLDWVKGCFAVVV